MVGAFIRRLKLSYAVYNFFHRKDLRHNTSIYRKLGLKKQWYSPISSKDFAGWPAEAVGSATDAALTATNLYHKTTPEGRNSILSFNATGYCILPNYLRALQADAINDEVDHLLQEKKAQLKYGKKIMFAFHQSKLISGVGRNADLEQLLGALLSGEAVLFQSMNFMYGSELATHSDSFHMSTYPLGALLGVWIALEDVTDENGPLHYYPGSHLLPYYMNGDYDNEGSYFMTGAKSYAAYEQMMAEKIVVLGLKKEIWRPKKGDLMIWHANLFHGGEPQANKTKTRKSMVLHYFKKGVICYHEITQRPALLKKAP
jgi:phytanoyl-CoA hydroxylase